MSSNKDSAGLLKEGDDKRSIVKELEYKLKSLSVKSVPSSGKSEEDKKKSSAVPYKLMKK